MSISNAIYYFRRYELSFNSIQELFFTVIESLRKPLEAAQQEVLIAGAWKNKNLLSVTSEGPTKY